MKTYYRVDVYVKNMGDLIGFYDEYPLVGSHIEGTDIIIIDKGLSHHELLSGGSYVEITEFTADEDVYDTDELEAWYNGNIVQSYYYDYF